MLGKLLAVLDSTCVKIYKHILFHTQHNPETIHYNNNHTSRICHPHQKKGFLKNCTRDFPGGPVIKNLPSKAGDTGSIPGRGTKIPHANGKTKPTCCNY